MTEHWQDRPEGGGRRAIWLFRVLALRGGRRYMRLWLYPIALYFYLRRGSERRASQKYISRIFERPASPWQVLKHLHCFGATMLDRIYLLANGEKDFEIEVQGVEALEQHNRAGRGVLLVGSHQGSFEVLRAISSRCPTTRLRVLLDKQKTPAITEMLETLAPEVGAAVIDVSQGGARVTLAVAEACRDGEMVALLADRGRAHETLRKVPFLGKPAEFPVGPWLLAHTLQVPVMLCFGLYLGGNRYRLIFEPFAERIAIPREARGVVLDELIGRYVQRLEHYARLLPYNWFNFHDVWQDQVLPVEPSSARAEALREA